MDLHILMLPLLVALVLAEPPVPQGQYGPPSSQYGAPGGFGSGGFPGGAGGRPSSQYGAPGFGAGGGYPGGAGGGYKDPRDTPMFTHEQDFQRPSGEVWGKWSVTLPDGRIQRVEYDADETGFHPVITYEEPGGSGNGGGMGNGYSGQGGYRYR